MAAHGVGVSFPSSGPQGWMKAVVKLRLSWITGSQETQHHFLYQVEGRKTVTVGAEMRSGVNRRSQESLTNILEC